MGRLSACSASCGAYQSRLSTYSVASLTIRQSSALCAVLSVVTRHEYQGTHSVSEILRCLVASEIFVGKPEQWVV